MLRSFISLLGFEISKAIRMKLTWVTLLLPVALTLLTVWMDRLSHGVRAIATGGGRSAPEPSAYLSFAKAGGNGLTLGAIMLLIYASMVMANEGSWRTFKTIMLRPHWRISWVLGKFILLLLMAVALVVCVSGAAYLAGSGTGKFGDISEDNYVIFEAAFMKKNSLMAIALATGPIIALGAFGLMFSTMTDNTGIAASGCLGSYIILEMAKSARPENKPFFLNTFAPSLSDTSYFQALRGFAQGLSDTGWENSAIHYNIVTPIVWAAVCLVIAMVIFWRRNFLN